MANNKPFDNLRRQLEAVVNERANRVANEVSGEVVKVFVQRAKNRLQEASNDFTPESAGIINSLAENITYEEQPYFQIGKTTKKPEEVTRAFVRIKRDPQNLLMFLEYGTGIAGSYNEHPDAGKIGWKYVVNPHHYKRAERIIPDLKYNKMGWFFNKKPMSVIKKDDHENIVVSHKAFQVVSGYTRNGRPVKSYVRKIKDRPDRIIDKAVFTQGIKPVRFIYNTKQELKNLFKASKGSSTVDEFYKELNKLENK